MPFRLVPEPAPTEIVDPVVIEIVPPKSPALILMPANPLFCVMYAGEADGVVVPISTVKSDVGVNAFGFVTVPVQVKLEPVALHPSGCAAAGPPPMIRPNANAEMKHGGA